MWRLAAGVLVVCGVGCASVAGAAPLCTVLADAESGKILLRQGNCEARLTPVSTFKFALSLIGYDSGYLTDEHHPALPYREEYVASDPAWRTTIDPTSWMTDSVVWYSQQLTIWLGKERLQRYITHFKYGNQDLSGNAGMNDGLTQSWLDSSLRISPLEQITFLEKLVKRQLGVSARAYEMTARITSAGQVAGGWELHGKAGTGFQMKPDDGPDLTRQIGWYVGWASRGSHTVVFAYALSDEQPQKERAGIRARAALLAQLPALLQQGAGGTH